MEEIVPAGSVCIAVLPFENLSDSRDYFSTGFVEDIITDLSHFANLQVISSYTARKLGAKVREEIKLARELAIDYLLKGSLRYQHGTLRINTQLLDTATDSVLWAERYDAPGETVFDVQDNIVEQVVGAISTRIDQTLLAASRKKPITSLVAYDCWLQGMEHLRLGSLAADQEARRTFEQALSIDPQYSRAYAGLSLSYFNEWSCQLWELYEESERNAYNYAAQAVELDDTDHLTQLILSRIYLYRRQFEMAEQHLQKSISLNSNDADSLVQIASCKSFLGEAEEGRHFFRKALRLDPFRNAWYFPYGSFTYFVLKEYRDSIDMAQRGPLANTWVDLPAQIAAAHAYLEEREEAEKYLLLFRDSFQKSITAGRPPETREMVEWLEQANPFRYKEDRAHYVDGILFAGLDRMIVGRKGKPAASSEPEPSAQVFIKEGELWRMSYEGTTVTLPEIKGFYDLARLLSTPEHEIHAADILGSPTGMGDSVPALDEQARRSYEQRITELQEELNEAEELHDLGRKEKSRAELDALVDHLAKSLGLGKRTRTLKSSSERARTAVTWRIRSAIKKIHTIHPTLAKHLDNAVRTGNFCSYVPEKNNTWLT